MHNLIARFALYLASSLLAAIPAAWAARWGLSFDGATISADLATLASVGLFAAISGAGLSAAVFAVSGTGGLPGLLRTLLYSLSPGLGALAVGLSGWGVAYADGIVSLHLPTLIGAAVASSTGAAGVLRRWGASPSGR